MNRMITHSNTKETYNVIIEFDDSKFKISLTNKVYINCTNLMFDDREFDRLYEQYMQRRDVTVKGKQLRSGNCTKSTKKGEPMIGLYPKLFSILCELEHLRIGLNERTRGMTESESDSAKMKAIKYGILILLRCLEKYHVNAANPKYYPPWEEMSEEIIDLTSTDSD